MVPQELKSIYLTQCDTWQNDSCYFLRILPTILAEFRCRYFIYFLLCRYFVPLVFSDDPNVWLLYIILDTCFCNCRSYILCFIIIAYTYIYIYIFFLWSLSLLASLFINMLLRCPSLCYKSFDHHTLCLMKWINPQIAWQRYCVSLVLFDSFYFPWATADIWRVLLCVCLVLPA